MCLVDISMQIKPAAANELTRREAHGTVRELTIAKEGGRRRRIWNPKKLGWCWAADIMKRF